MANIKDKLLKERQIIGSSVCEGDGKTFEYQD